MNTRTNKREDTPRGVSSLLFAPRPRTRTHLNAARMSAAGEGWTEPNLNFLPTGENANRVRSPSPPQQGVLFCYAGRIRTAGESPGSAPTAAGGGRREGSEWLRSVCNAAASSARRTPGTATGHPAPLNLPLFDTIVSNKGRYLYSACLLNN